MSAQEAGVTDTFRATETLYALTGEPPQAQLWQGRLQPEAAANTLDARLQRDREALEAALQSLCAPPGESSEDPSDPPVATGDDPADSEQPPFELNIDGLAVPAPPNVTQLLQSLDEQLDQVPPEWLTAAGDAPYPEQPADTAEALDETPAADAIHYDEWDELRQSYRADWCTLREMESQAVEDDFPARTLDKYRHLVAALRRYFAALRGEPRTLRGQPDGPELDLDALITAQIDLRLGREPGDRLFTRPSKIERDLAVAFMVDASGSTKGWINQAERESLLLLCEALEELGDRYAIYGFSGMTRNRCEIYRIKTFNEPADAQVRARISGLQPRDYTRMGVAIRHICKQLQAVEARTRLLITLSDGKPDDYDGYRGDYGIADTRQALQEARQAGLQAFCITIDREAAGYLPRMYGAANYVVIDELHQLPLKVADIYRKLTT